MILCSALFFSSVSCAGRTAGTDSDHDGLSDKQEMIFGTDPQNPDTDGDGILDGKDPEPLPGAPAMKVSADPVKILNGISCSKITILLTDGSNLPLSGKTIEVDTDLGTVSPVNETKNGLYETELCTSEKGVARVTVIYDDKEDKFLPIKAEIKIYFTLEKEMPQPGINPPPYVESGELNGFLRVFTVYGDSVFLPGNVPPLPFNGAFVTISYKGKTATKYTNSEGFVEFIDDDLRDSVNITAGAPGYRYTTLINVNASNISLPIHRLDPEPEKDEHRVGTITGVVRGFEGFPASEGIFGKLNVAIVQTALKNVPLSSISAGNILEPSVKDEIAAIPIPSNLVIHNPADPENATYRLENVVEGSHLVFALAGQAEKVIDAICNPYLLKFKPIAMGIERMEVEGGKVNVQDITLNIDLTHEDGKTIQVYLGALPPDPLTGKELPNGLLLPVMDTGGEGFIFVDVNSVFNYREEFEDYVVTSVRFPEESHWRIKELGLKLTPLVVGLAGREAYRGADPQGISTAIKTGAKPGDSVYHNKYGSWLYLPEGVEPEPPASIFPLDSVGGKLKNGKIAWKKVTEPVAPHLYVIRINYMTAAPANPLCNEGDENSGSLGGPRSHCLWEFIAPGSVNEITLPELPEASLINDILKNPVPNDNNKNAPQHYGANTLELEINAYRLGAYTKEFDYNKNFLFEDFNLQAASVSQDSYLFYVK